jgi:nucleotide-binding universal stress UspA family protein
LSAPLCALYTLGYEHTLAGGVDQARAAPVGFTTASQMGSRMASHTFTLREAAAQLGVSPHTLRMRWKRGLIEGYKMGGRIYILVVDEPSQPSQVPSQPDVHSEPSPVNPLREAIAEYELDIQKRELARLREELVTAREQLETERRRYDDIVADNRRTRESEAVLRSQLQNIVLQLQERLSLPAPDTDRLDRLERENGQLRSGVVDLVGYIQKKSRGV